MSNDPILMTAILVKETVIKLRDNMRRPDQCVSALACALVMMSRIAGIDPRAAFDSAMDAERELPLDLDRRNDA